MSRSNVSAQLARPADWQDGRESRQTDDAPAVEEIRRVIRDLPSHGYRRVWGALREDRQVIGLMAFNAKCIYRVMSTHGLLMERRRHRLARSDDTTAKLPWHAVTSVSVRTASSSGATTASRCA